MNLIELLNSAIDGNNEDKKILEERLSKATGEVVVLHRRLDMPGSLMAEYANGRMFFVSEEMIINTIENNDKSALEGSELL